MATAWQIFVESWHQANRNFTGFLKIWLVTLVLFFIILAFWGASFLNSFSEYAYNLDADITGGQLIGKGLIGVTIGLFYFITVCGMSVNSHRLYLDPEYQPSWAPFAYRWPRTFGYLAEAILLVLIYIGIMAIPSLLARSWLGGQLMSGYISRSTLTALALIAFIAWTLMAWICSRLYNALVATSLGEDMSFGDAWRQSRSLSATYLFLIFIVALFGILFALIVQLVFTLLVNIGGTAGVVLFWISAILLFLAYIYIYAIYYSLFSQLYLRVKDL